MVYSLQLFAVNSNFRKNKAIRSVKFKTYRNSYACLYTYSRTITILKPISSAGPVYAFKLRKVMAASVSR